MAVETTLVLVKPDGMERRGPDILGVPQLGSTPDLLAGGLHGGQEGGGGEPPDPVGVVVELVGHRGGVDAELRLAEVGDLQVPRHHGGRGRLGGVQRGDQLGDGKAGAVDAEPREGVEELAADVLLGALEEAGVAAAVVLQDPDDHGTAPLFESSNRVCRTASASRTQRSSAISAGTAS